MLGRTCAIGGIALLWTLGCVAQTFAADMSMEEREQRTQTVVIVKPAEEGADSKKERTEGAAELERAIQDEKQKKQLLELKLKSLHERVATERRKVGMGPAPVSPLPTDPKAERRSDQHTVTHPAESDDDSHLVREYIWVPKHREGDKILEGSYVLEEK